MAPSSTKSKKPKLDEESFQKLLAAAFVVQEHQNQQQASQDARRSPAAEDKDLSARPPYAYVMEEIVATQHQIQTRRLQLQQSIDLITDRVRSIAQADGAAVVLIENRNDFLVYRSATGISSNVAGKRVKLPKLLCAESIRNGTTLQCLDPGADFRIDQQLCATRGIQSLIAVPVYRDDSIVGALEVVFSNKNAFGEQDVRTCQVMAGMVTEALNRAAEMELKKTIVDERATMLKALEQLKPQLQRLVKTPDPITGEQTTSCLNCNKELRSGEQKCAYCGTPVFGSPDLAAEKSGSEQPGTTKAANSEAGAAPNAQKASPGILKAPLKPLRPSEVPQPGVDEGIEPNQEYEIPASVLDELEARLREYDPDRHVTDEEENISSPPDGPSVGAEIATADENESSKSGNADHEEEPDHSPDHNAMTEDLALVPQPRITDEEEDGKLRITPVAPDEAWASAWKTKAWLESITDRSTGATFLRYLNRYRGELYLVTAILVVAFAVWWSVWGSSGSGVGPAPIDNTGSTTSKRRSRPPETELSLYDRFLIAIGLAEAPPAPIYEGNPDTKVWVDLQTGLYYCPNADLYGTTSKGRFTTQKDAQMDQFEPADRRACD